MKRAPHRIRRQRWLVRTGSEADAFALRLRLRASWQPALLPEFERAFDAFAPSGEVVRLSRLVLHIRVAPGEDPVAQMPELLARALAEQFRKTAEESDAARTGASRATGVPLEDDLLDGLIAYLLSGVLRWHDAGAASAEIRARLGAAARRHAHDVGAALRAMAAPASAITRLLQLVPSEAWVELADALLAALPAARRAAAVAIVRAIVSTRHEAGAQVARDDVASALATALIGSDAEASDGLVALARRLAPEIAREAPSAPEPSVMTSPRSLKRTAPARPSDASPVAPPVEPLVAPRTHRQSPATDGAYPLTVPHGGLILLHPFLPRFFAATRVIAEGSKTPAPTELPRAIALLHHLAVGPDAEPCDFELPFIRVLLGLAPDAANSAGHTLSAADLAEAESLLQSVIAHWSALKSTSIAGLRQSFLQRAGLLHDTEDGWRLHLERGPFDVLLDRLPWALGTVKLPWMPRAIHTEW